VSDLGRTGCTPDPGAGILRTGEERRNGVASPGALAAAAASSTSPDFVRRLWPGDCVVEIPRAELGPGGEVKTPLRGEAWRWAREPTLADRFPRLLADGLTAVPDRARMAASSFSLSCRARSRGVRAPSASGLPYALERPTRDAGPLAPRADPAKRPDPQGATPPSDDAASMPSVCEARGGTAMRRPDAAGLREARPARRDPCEEESDPEGDIADRDDA